MYPNSRGERFSKIPPGFQPLSWTQNNASSSFRSLEDPVCSSQTWSQGDRQNRAPAWTPFSDLNENSIGLAPRSKTWSASTRGDRSGFSSLNDSFMRDIWKDINESCKNCTNLKYDRNTVGNGRMPSNLVPYGCSFDASAGEALVAETLTAYASKGGYRPPRMRRRVPSCVECVFCKNNGAHETDYRSHILKDPEGNILCPILRAYNCPVCNNGGGNKAHTIRYCPLNRPNGWRKPSDGPEGPPPIF